MASAVINAISDLLVSVPAILMAIIVHEYGHGWVAKKFGDYTATDLEQLTFKPFVHIDIFGFLMLVWFKFGWSKTITYDSRNFKNPLRDTMLVIVSGAIANVLCSLLFVLLLHLYAPTPQSYVYNLIMTTIQINFNIALINILPIPPFDGARVVEVFYKDIMRLEPIGKILLLFFFLTKGINPFKGLVFSVMQILI